MNILMIEGTFLSDTTCDFTFPNLILFCFVQSETMEKENISCLAHKASLSIPQLLY